MKKLIFLCFTNSLHFGQNGMDSFNWEGAEVENTLTNLLILQFVSVDKLPHKFNLQLDLGAITTVFFMVTNKPYLEKYSLSKIDNDINI
jgi:hypothetical protein